MIDRSTLQDIVEDFRKKIEPCWSKESAYRVPDIQKYGPYISGGQCAVTCLVLIDVLKELFPNEQILLISGQVQVVNGGILMQNHGWLRVGSGTNAIIIDPTADQAMAIGNKVFIGIDQDLESQNLQYVTKEIETDQGEVEHPKRFARYQILKQAWERNK